MIRSDASITGFFATGYRVDVALYDCLATELLKNGAASRRESVCSAWLRVVVARAALPRATAAAHSGLVSRFVWTTYARVAGSRSMERVLMEPTSMRPVGRLSRSDQAGLGRTSTTRVLARTIMRILTTKQREEWTARSNERRNTISTFCPIPRTGGAAGKAKRDFCFTRSWPHDRAAMLIRRSPIIRNRWAGSDMAGRHIGIRLQRARSVRITTFSVRWWTGSSANRSRLCGSCGSKRLLSTASIAPGRNHAAGRAWQSSTRGRHRLDNSVGARRG